MPPDTSAPRAVLLSADLLFGSKVESFLNGAGCAVDIHSDASGARAACADGRALLVVDLTSDDFDGAALVSEMRAAGELNHTTTLGFYAHTDAETKRRADAAGFTLVVPRSRLAREGADLITGLLAAAAGR